MYPQVFGKYVLERELARGGMARVLLATLKGAGGFEKKLVVKQIRDELAYDEFIRRFVEEAKTTVALSHPNIVPVYELGVELGTYFLAMEYVEGASIAEVLRAARDGDASNRSPLSPEQGAYVGVEVCRALDYAHRRMKVVHRDVTPRNVMVDEEGQVKVIDFGIAAPASVGGHEVFGSPGHMPPEQSEGKEVTPATDVFAVAVLLLEVWGGKAPFRRKEAKEIEALMQGKRPRPSDIDIRLLPLDDIFARALSLDPAARPQEADELGRALRKFLAGVDLGDVARELGTRVRDLRAKPPPPAAPKKIGLQRPPSRGSAAEIRTKTFAARDVVQEWGPTGPSTRKIPVSEPPAPPPSRDADKTAPGDAIETMATKPIETVRRPQRGAGRAGIAMIVAIVGAAAVGGFLVAKALSGTAPVPTPTATASATATATATANPTANPTATANPTMTTTATTTTNPTTSATTSATAAATADAADAAPKAKLTLQCEPGTVVAVDGASRGGCPVTLSLEQGAHDVRFTFTHTNESRGQAITLKPGESAGMRADFTSATPSIRVWR